MPRFLSECIKTWKEVMPEYELILWDKNKFDINSVPFVSEACSVKKWAFAADYLRLYAVYTEGGIYLDCDVIVRKSFTNFLDYDFFTSLEYGPEVAQEQNTAFLLNEDGTLKKSGFGVRGIGFQAAIFGGIQGHPFLRDCLDWYENNHYILPDGEYGEFNMYIAPDIYAGIAQKYGFRYRQGLQKLKENMVVLPYYVFPNYIGNATNDTYALHYCYSSWVDKTLYAKLFQKIVLNEFIRKVFGRKPLFEKIFERVNE